jgi:hypothetical protein
MAAAVLLLFIGAGVAQERERDYDWYHRDRDDRWQGDRWRSRLFWQVREDLDHVQASSFAFGRDQYRIQRTKQELNELQDKLAAGRYDERELDDVIGALRRVVADNRLSPRDRDILNDDLHRLQEYREHHEGWGRR